ncbi:acyl-CoA N-acyltransferase with RING/FYVE/PHD-type zinc finger protein [Artemisia annua]|uniref:Acyl-CoA N-acyltransferase with RING/FYVE/PHD-type zinc finger protein n=1 Tax=Artemisia annua TaxID=35608 RepID=A0A2U1KT96_ARTAN|nr:acyl-CoA N-acyltransferase with RING/FYVE/PHD-type zinc finger protein [Artemisia annua]
MQLRKCDAVDVKERVVCHDETVGDVKVMASMEIDSGSDKEVCKKGVEFDCDMVKCVKEGNESASVDLTLSPNVECDKDANNGPVGIDEKCVGAVAFTYHKRGRKRKVLESPECNGDVGPKKMEVEKVGRMLRSRTKPPSSIVKVDDSKLKESVVGFKRQMEAECLDQTKLEKEVKESSKRTGGPQKKRKRLGRPPKVQGENKDTVKKPKPKGKDVKASSKVHNVQNKDELSESVDQTELEKEVNESSKRTGRPQKKQKVQGEKQDTVKKQKGKDVKASSKVHNVQNGDGSSETANDNKQTIKVSEENNADTTTEGTAKGRKTEQVKASKQERQLVRDQIVNMITKAGWTIEYRQRQERNYHDAVYVDLDGKTNWSITKAYFSLKKKIEGNTATKKEVSAFTPIPDEEIGVLFKTFSKVRSDKNTKKKKYKNKAKVVVIGEAPPKKKPGKKIKDGNKKKERRANKSSSKKGPKVTQKGKQNRKPRLLARSSKKGSDQEDDDALFSGKRNLISWMIDSGVIKPGGKLQHGEGKSRKELPEGTVSSDGIHCSCCDEIMDISKFVSHGGWKLDEALKNICYQSGPSLLTCLLESWKKEEESTSIKFNSVDALGEDPNDDTCNICGDGGDLICCDGCPSTFNQSCLDIQNFPSGDWHCIYCSCKFCGLADNDASQVDDSEDAPNSEMLTCSMCEQKFHDSCLHALCASKDEDADEDVVNVESSCLSFCGKKCRELYEQLQTYIDVKFELKDGYSMTLLKRSDLSQDSTLNDPLKVLCNSKLAVAFSVMDECFVPVMDERSGVNVIHNVVYNCGSNFTRLNFSGFCTAILERSGELIAAASIRIHGHQLAEMPFIGTRNMYRRQGMCRRLLDAIEDALGSLGVEELVIPAIPELFDTWTKVFGFKPLQKSRREATKSMSIIVFPGTDMLQKPLYKNQVADNNLSSVADDKPVECITVVNDDDEQKPAARHESEKPATS